MIPLRHTVPSGTVETCFVPPKDKGSELTLKPSYCSVSSRVRSKTFPPGKPASILNGLCDWVVEFSGHVPTHDLSSACQLVDTSKPWLFCFLGFFLLLF